MLREPKLSIKPVYLSSSTRSQNLLPHAPFYKFNFDIQHRPGTQHAFADYLSQIENEEEEINRDEDFPDSSILHIATEDPERNPTPLEDKWITEMSGFLSIGLPPPRMRTDKKKRLAVWSCNFYLVEDTSYHKGTDGIWRICSRSDEKETVLRKGHYGIAGGHYARDTTTRKIWQVGL